VTVESERARIAERIQARAKGTAFAFVVFDLGDGDVLGRCGINFITRGPAFGNVGYWVRTSRRGQGIAPAAVRQLARFGFERVGLVRLELVIDVDNTASIRVAEKAGAVLEGVLRNRVVGQAGEPRQACMYSLIPERVEARESWPPRE
jgi:RimJ/RimL family protein N-acetyltransferase